MAAVKAALEHIKRFRVEAVKGKSDDELKTLLIRTVKGDDPARIAALLVSPYYMESAITQSARLTPVVKAMRLQDRREESRYIQPTNLSFMTFRTPSCFPCAPIRMTRQTRTNGMRTSRRRPIKTTRRKAARISTAGHDHPAPRA